MGVGATLKTHYTNPVKVAELIALGGLSVLGEHVDPDPDLPHSFDGPQQDGVTVSYRRDRGEDDMPAREANTIKEAKRLFDAEYVYVFNPDTRSWWTYRA